MNQVCGCCEPDAPLTPLRVENRPGLSAIAYRIGTYASFRETMLQKIATTPEIFQLATRRSDDLAITIMELWAAVADVLTFYQERYANEVFLRTARQRASVAQLTRLIGYQLRPGAAALARLAFTVDDGKTVDIPSGLKVQSVPAHNEQPQTFETIEALTADARFNRLRLYPAPTSFPALAPGRLEAFLDRTAGPAIAAALAPSDRVVLFNNGAAQPIEEKAVATLRPEEDHVALQWQEPIQNDTWNASTLAYKVGRRFRLFGHNAPGQFMTPASSGTTPQRITWTLHTLDDYSYPQHGEEAAVGARSRLCLDGRYEGLSVGQQLLVDDTIGVRTLVKITAIDQAQVTLGALTETATRLTVEPLLVASGSSSAGGASFGVLASGFGGSVGGFGSPVLASSLGSSFFGPGGLTIGPVFARSFTDRRKVIIHELQGLPIMFWDFRYDATINAAPVYLPGWKVVDDAGAGIEVGRTIERNHFRPGVVLRPSEFALGRAVLLLDTHAQPVLGTITTAPTITPAGAAAGTFCHLVLTVDVAGTLALETASAVLLGNVALASHGETVHNEVVGSGNASQKFQKLTLKKHPLTYVPSASAQGVDSTLTLLINGVRWHEVPGLFGQPPTAQVYETRLGDQGETLIQTGDGETGAVLPSGQNNVTATYRVGLGLAGRVGASSLTTLLPRPPGLKEVTNPAPAEGGADPETLEHARDNAPETVRTFGRAVSLTDFEDLVTASGEVAKAQATWVWDGFDRAIHLTVAAQEGGLFSTESLRRLADALTAARDPNHRLRLANFIRVPIVLQARLTINADFVQADVMATARAAIEDALSFEVLQLGQSMHLSDVYRVLQDVAGVVAVDVDTLMFKQPATMSAPDFDAFLTLRGVARQPNGQPQPVQGHLRILPALSRPMTPGIVHPAEMAWIENRSQDITLTAIGGL